MTRHDLDLRALADLEAEVARERDPLRLRRLQPFGRALADRYAASMRAACWRLRKRLYGPRIEGTIVAPE